LKVSERAGYFLYLYNGTTRYIANGRVCADNGSRFSSFKVQPKLTRLIHIAVPYIRILLNIQYIMQDLIGSLVVLVLSFGNDYCSHSLTLKQMQ